MSTKSWVEKKEEANKKGKVKKQTDKGMMYISCPDEIEKIIRAVPKGKVITTKQIVEKLTKKHGVDFTCPLTTGIFISIIANVSEELMKMGKTKKEVAPYWRVVKPPKGYLYEKYLGGKFPQKKYLKAEGLKIVPSGTKKGPVVKDFEKYI